MIVAVLSLWHMPYWAAAIIYCLGMAIYYIPHPAATRCAVPTWFRIGILAIIGGVLAFPLFVNLAAPVGSIVRLEYKYGALAILLLQVAFDFYRQKRVRPPQEEPESRPPL